MVYKQRTHNGFAVLRPIIADSSPENLAKAAEDVKRMRIYPLGQNPKTKYVDLYDKLLDMTPVLDKNIYREIHEMIEEEPVETYNLSMMGLLAKIGIRKGEPFKPSDELEAIHAKAAPDALEYMIEEYHRVLNPPFYKGKKWSALMPPGAVETDFSYEFPSHLTTTRGAPFTTPSSPA